MTHRADLTPAARRAPTPGPRAVRMARGAFTLVEILIVVVILGILSAITFTTFSSASQDAAAAAAQTDLKHIQTKVELEAQENGGTFPAEITLDLMRTWFRTVRPHPYSLATTPLGVDNEMSDDATINHPTDKLIAGAVPGWWYNPANGIVRSRVRDLGDPDMNVELYKRVNITSIGGLSDVN